MRIALLAIMFLLAVLAAALHPLSLVYVNQPVSAGATYTPTRFDDPEPDGCQPDDCSLREAIIAANNNPGPDTITLGAGQYDVNLISEGRNGQFTPPLGISDDTVVVGLGADRTRVDGDGKGGVFVIQHPTFADISVQIADLAIQDGLANFGGGAIHASRGVSLDIRRVTMTGNGGGGGNGGAILANYGAVTIMDSTITDNWAQNGGAVRGGGPLTITNSTISGNQAMSGIGGIVSHSATLTNVTVTGNTGRPDSANGVWGAGNTAVNSIIAGNTGSQCGGITSLGHNLYSDDSCGLGSGDVPSTDPMLGTLADNGGPTLTHALLAGSPAINAGDNGGCPSTDQRGIPRPQAGTCDIGAYEYVAPATPAAAPAVVTASPTPTPTLLPDFPTPTTTPSPSPTAKSSPLRTPRRSETPSPSPASSTDEEGGGDSGALILGLGLGGLAVAGAGGGGRYYLWRRSAAGLRLWPPWS